MKIQTIQGDFTVCQVKNFSQVNWEDDYIFMAKTDQEQSLVCQTKFVPANATQAEHGWKGFRVEGTLDFSLVGILAEISALLAKASISIYAVSTYDTDYIFVKAQDYDKALSLLKSNGHG